MLYEAIAHFRSDHCQDCICEISCHTFIIISVRIQFPYGMGWKKLDILTTFRHYIVCAHILHRLTLVFLRSACMELDEVYSHWGFLGPKLPMGRLKDISHPLDVLKVEAILLLQQWVKGSHAGFQLGRLFWWSHQPKRPRLVGTQKRGLSVVAPLLWNFLSPEIFLAGSIANSILLLCKNITLLLIWPPLCF